MHACMRGCMRACILHNVAQPGVTVEKSQFDKSVYLSAVIRVFLCNDDYVNNVDDCSR